jgi:two-component system, NtrC family, sensor histidine kinase HydH
MTLRSKLTVLFFAALQVTFLTAVGTFWAVQSWQLLTDDLTLIHDQNLRLERAVDGRRPAALRALRHHAQSLEEVELVDALATNPGEGAQRLKKFYHVEVNRLRERARFVTRLSTGLFLAIVTLVLAGMMAYFTAIRVWLVRPLQALGRATGVISTGDLAHRIPVGSGDEFGTLAESINTMAASLAEHQRRLLAAERFAMVGEMSAYVAHNIRNPLASIRTTAQAEFLSLGEQDPRRESFRDIVTATDRLESWIGDLLRFSSPVTLVRTPESVNALVERCTALARAQLAGKGLRLELALEPALAPVPLDRNKMEQVFSAVLANAMDASPAGATIRVSSALRQPNHVPLACIRVEDAGPGIPADRVGKLFTLFSTTKKSGTGLGLALAQKIVTAHDGTISVTSRAGEGTVVEISLPATERSVPRGDDPHR